MSRDDHTDEREEEEFVIESSPCLRPRIFEGNWREANPSGFEAVIIDLDGHIQADLDWKKVRQQAQEAVDKGYFLLWNMQMGLFQGLTQPLTSQSQFLSLTLALEHFRDSLWKEFKPKTLGLSIFRGSADFSRNFCWDEHQEQNLRNWLYEIEAPHLAVLDFSQLRQHAQGKQLSSLFCRDVAVEYLALLATRLPDAMPAYLYLDATSFSSHLIEMQMLNPERFDRLHLILKGHRLPFEVMGWGTPTSYGYSGHVAVDLPASQSPLVGICIPPMHYYHAHHYQGLEEGILALKKKSISFKLIAECQLTSQWDGLDYLLYSPTGLSMQGKRKLQGFCAAGGTVVSTGDLLGLPYELSLKDWLQLH
jgi:hypothetical protein